MGAFHLAMCVRGALVACMVVVAWRIRVLDVGTRSSFGVCSSQVPCSKRLEVQN